jgi:hypothetical protein
MNKKVKKQEETIKISKKPDDSYPVFCFKYLQPYSYNKCSDPEFFIEFLERLKKLGSLGWKGINTAARHSFGYEKIPKKQLKPTSFPPIITEEVKELTVFRATGNNHPFLGIRVNDTFQVIFIETNFGDIYDH